MVKMSITLYCGPMFAGKTNTILDRICQAEKDGVPFIAIKHSIDNRYGDEDIISHSQHRHSAVKYDNLTHFLESDAYKSGIAVTGGERLELVIVDEGEFFLDLAPACKQMRSDGIQVIVGALDFSFECKWFKPVEKLMKIADTMHRLRAQCGICDAPACFTHRKKEVLSSSQANELVVVGGSELYVPTCEKCWAELNLTTQVAVEDNKGM